MIRPGPELLNGPLSALSLLDAAAMKADDSALRKPLFNHRGKIQPTIQYRVDQKPHRVCRCYGRR